jgi:hypothetical protein
MSRFVLGLVLAGGAAASTASAQSCVVTGVSTSDYGAGTGFLQPSGLYYGFDPSICSLVWKLDAPTCCNVFVAQHWIVIGNAVDPVGLPLGGPFYPGSVWHVGAPLFALGPIPSTTGQVQLPPDPALIGLSLPTQAVLDFFTTIGMTHDFGMSQGVELKFQ